MPKVTEEYYEKKKSEILDAAYKVFTTKPITSVVMKDIIAETGFSHGVVYKYYKNLDDILVDLVIKMNSQSTLPEKVTALLSNAKEKDWQKIIRKTCTILSDDLIGTDLAVLNFSIYCDALTIGDPERVLKMGERIKGEYSSPLTVPIAMMTEYLGKVIETEKLRPTMSVEEIIQFIIVTYSGIQNDYALSQALKTPEMEGQYAPDVMFSFLAEAVIGVLKGKSND